jgi:hypothetical protein
MNERSHRSKFGDFFFRETGNVKADLKIFEIRFCIPLSH